MNTKQKIAELIEIGVKGYGAGGMLNKEAYLDIAGKIMELWKSNEAIKENYDEFLRYYFNAPCSGCPEGHSSFWRTITRSPEWKAWTDTDPHYDIPECEELGIMGEQHWKDFVKFITQAHKEG